MNGPWSRRVQLLRGTWRRRRRPWRASSVLVGLTLLATAGAAYTVRPGDTLSELAQHHGIAVQDLVEANGIADPDHIVAGETLRIPGGSGTPEAASGRGTAGSARTHVVAAGETLDAIARRHGLSVEQLAAANGLTNPDRVMAGMLLRVAASPPPTPGGGSSWSCVVPGGRYVNDFGVAKPDGRHHEGVDVHAPRGTIVRAPVSGTIRHTRGPRGGLQFVLRGSDGYTYIGTHMDAYGRDGRVQQGDAVGTVGTSGNARGTSPHLHLEMHHGSVVNPYPTLRAHC